MFSLAVKETYQRTISNRVWVNFDVSRYLATLEEVNENIHSIEQELDDMNVIQKRTRVTEKAIIREIEYSRPGKIGTLIRTISVIKYNPPKVKVNLI